MKKPKKSHSSDFPFNLNYLPILNTLLYIVRSYKILNVITTCIYGVFNPNYKLTQYLKKKKKVFISRKHSFDGKCWASYWGL